MYSTRSVGSCFKRTRRSVGQSFSLRATHHRPQVPAPCVSSRGPGGNRTCLAMYSTTAVERVSVCIKRTDEGVARGLRALPLSYGAAVFSSAGGTRTHNHGIRSACTPNRQSVCIQWATRLLAREVGCDLVVARRCFQHRARVSAS